MHFNFTKSAYLLLFCFLIINVNAQSTAERVYTIFQTNCTFSSCHDNLNQAFGLDLQGSGVNPMMDVYDNIVGVVPNNNHAGGIYNSLIKPGDPSRSFIFRKIQNGLDGGISLHTSEGSPMPLSAAPLNEEDIELVRQWILYGAPASGEVVDISLIDQFYNNNGVQSIPNPPDKPDPSEGFQLHLGPYFIPPGQEKEVFLKHNPFFEENQEIIAAETFMGTQSHHFIINRFLREAETFCGVNIGGAGPDAFAEGYRGVDDPSHFNALFQVGAQNPSRWEAPYKTAFVWKSGDIIDLNSHYINANPSHVLSADIYVNIYTQQAGEAIQEMQAIMVPNNEIDIPNDGSDVILSLNLPIGFCFPSGIYLYALNSHTHKLGKDFDIYKSTASGTEVEHLFDASCINDAVPGCVDSFYDYQHPPERRFENYYKLLGSDWMKQKARYVNNTDQDVGFGFTSNDEMMIMFLFFVSDTAGLINIAPDAVEDFASTNQEIPVIIPVLLNDFDAVDAIKVCGIATEPANGTVIINNDSTITYIPNDGFFGTDQFQYTACDDVVNGSLSDIGTVTVTVNAPSGLFDIAYKIVNVYPNPSSGWINIYNPSEMAQDVHLLNIQGQEIQSIDFEMQGDLIRINLLKQGIPQGMYWIVVENEDNSKGVGKVIFQSLK